MNVGLPVAILLAFAASTAGALASSPQLRLGQELLPPDGGHLPSAKSGDGMILRLQAHFDCGTAEAEASLFVSVADTVVVTSSAKSPQPIVMELPAGQLRGVRESLACPGLGSYLMRAQLTAYATLTCRTANGAQASNTVNRPLDLWVECERRSLERDMDPEAEVAGEAATEE